MEMGMEMEMATNHLCRDKLINLQRDGDGMEMEMEMATNHLCRDKLINLQRDGDGMEMATNHLCRDKLINLQRDGDGMEMEMGMEMVVGWRWRWQRTTSLYGTGHYIISAGASRMNLMLSTFAVLLSWP